MPIEFGELLQVLSGHVPRHKEIVAATRNATPDESELSQRHKPQPMLAHDAKIQIRGAKILAPLPAAVIGTD